MASRWDVDQGQGRCGMGQQPNMFDAAAGFGGYKGQVRTRGGKRLYLYEAKWQDRPKPKLTEPKSQGLGERDAAVAVWKDASLASLGIALASIAPRRCRRRQRSGRRAPIPSPCSRQRRTLRSGQGRQPKDVRDAVEAAHAAHGWGKRAAHDRAFESCITWPRTSTSVTPSLERIDAMTGCGLDAGRKEVDASISQLFATLAGPTSTGKRQETPSTALQRPSTSLLE